MNKRAPKPRNKDDREIVTPPRNWVTVRRTPDPGSVAPRPTAKAVLRAQDAALFDAVCRTRPLRPPPMPAAENRQRTAGAWALANEIREGTYEP